MSDKSAILSATAPGSLTDARKTVDSIRLTITCNNYDVAYAKWAARPASRTVTVTVGNKRKRAPSPRRTRPRLGHPRAALRRKRPGNRDLQPAIR